MIADLIIVWPSNVDYPLFRSFIRQNRTLFNRVIIVFSMSYSGDDFTHFVNESMKDDACIILRSPEVKSGEDWRDVAVNYALNFAQLDWIWFWEQDFFVMDDMFWREVDKLSITSDVIGIDVSGRLHPCCLAIKRSILYKTRLRFGIVPNKLDHFGMIQQDLEAINAAISYIPEKYWYHMNGLSHNYYLAHEKKEVTYEPTRFAIYMQQCLDVVDVPLDDRFIKVAREVVRN